MATKNSQNRERDISTYLLQGDPGAFGYLLNLDWSGTTGGDRNGLKRRAIRTQKADIGEIRFNLVILRLCPSIGYLAPQVPQGKTEDQ